MTDEQIDHLIGARNRITDCVDEFIDLRAVDHIDAVLRDVPCGQRPDVDALLGRAPSTAPDGWLVNPAARLWGAHEWNPEHVKDQTRDHDEFNGVIEAAASIEETPKDWRDMLSDRKA